MASLIVITFLASRQTISATNDAVSQVSSFYLEAMADRRAKTITNLIENNFDYMEKAIDIIEDEEIKTQEELRYSIGMMKSLLSLSRFALVDEDNIVYTQYTTYTGGSRHDFLLQGELDREIISTVSVYGSSKQLCLVIPVHFKALDKNFKACFVQIDIKDIVDLLQDRGYDEMPEVVEAFNQETEAHIGENKVVVSIGYSTLAEGDKQLSDVFARADQMMYERKKELKSMGAKTRD